MKRLLKKDGFTLIELMIVVVIIGILAAIAIPNFLRYQLKSRFSEGGINTKAAVTANVAYLAKYRNYAMATAYPLIAQFDAEGKFKWDASPGAVPPSGNFYNIGFTPTGTVRFSYCIGDNGGQPGPAGATGIVLDGANFAEGLCAPATQITYDIEGTIIAGSLLPEAPGLADFTVVATTDLDCDGPSVPGCAGTGFNGQIKQTDIDTKVVPFVDLGTNAVAGEDIF